MLILAALFVCATPEVLDGVLDEKLLQLRPGITLAEVGRISSQSGESLEPQDGVVNVYLRTSRGRRSVALPLRCHVDVRQRLVDCAVAGPRQHVQLVTESDFDRLREGASVSDVISALCLPQRILRRPDGGLHLIYSIETPHAFVPRAPVFLRFDKDGHLKKKGHGVQ